MCPYPNAGETLSSPPAPQDVRRIPAPSGPTQSQVSTATSDLLINIYCNAVPSPSFTKSMQNAEYSSSGVMTTMPTSRVSMRPQTNPPVTITGVAPWGMQSQGKRSMPPSLRPPSSEKDSSAHQTLDGMSRVLAYIEECTPTPAVLPVNWQEQQVTSFGPAISAHLHHFHLNLISPSHPLIAATTLRLCMGRPP